MIRRILRNFSQVDCLWHIECRKYFLLYLQHGCTI